MARDSYHTTGEILRGVYIVGRATVTSLRGGDPSVHDAKVDRLNQQIAERREAEAQALQELADEKAAAAHRARVDAEKKRRESNSWF